MPSDTSKGPPAPTPSPAAVAARAGVPIAGRAPAPARAGRRAAPARRWPRSAISMSAGCGGRWHEVCRYCFAPLENGAAFCSDECADGAWQIVPTLDGEVFMPSKEKGRPVSRTAPRRPPPGVKCYLRTMLNIRTSTKSRSSTQIPIPEISSRSRSDGSADPAFGKTAIVEPFRRILPRIVQFDLMSRVARRSLFRHRLSLRKVPRLLMTAVQPSTLGRLRLKCH